MVSSWDSGIQDSITHIVIGPVDGTEDEICNAVVAYPSMDILAIGHGPGGEHWLRYEPKVEEHRQRGAKVIILYEDISENPNPLYVATRRPDGEYTPKEETIEMVVGLVNTSSEPNFFSYEPPLN